MSSNERIVMNTRRQALVLAGALTATVFTAAAALAGVAHRPAAAAARRDARRPGRPGSAATAFPRGGRLMRRVWATVVRRLGDARDRRGPVWTRPAPVPHRRRRRPRS